MPLVEGNVALDQVMVLPEQREVALFLPVGNYALFREFESGAAETVGRVSVR